MRDNGFKRLSKTALGHGYRRVFLVFLLMLPMAIAILWGVSTVLESSTKGQYKTSIGNFLLGRNAEFPSAPITIMAPAAPGGGWDRVARLIQHVYVTEDILGVPVEVENRGGAGGTIGLTEIVTQHRNDPYTLMVGGKTLVSAVLLHNSRFTINQATPLALLATEYSVIAVPADSPYKTLSDLTADFRTNPENFVWGGGAAGGADHLLIGQMAKELSIDPVRINFVAYSGGGPAATALLSNQVDAAVGGPEWRDLAAAGRVRFLAVSSPERLPGVSVPTIREAGVNVVMDNWRFIIAPPGISNSNKEHLISSLESMRASPEWPRMLENLGLTDVFLTGDELDRFLAEETSSTARLLAELQIGKDGKGYAAIGPFVFPVATLFLTVVVGGLLLLATIRKYSAGNLPSIWLIADNSPVALLPWRQFLLSAGLILAYAVLLSFTSFLMATPIFFVLQARLMGSMMLRRDVIVALILAAAIYIVFERLLSIPLP